MERRVLSQEERYICTRLKRRVIRLVALERARKKAKGENQ
jgi:hypothetical protein